MPVPTGIDFVIFFGPIIPIGLFSFVLLYIFVFLARKNNPWISTEGVNFLIMENQLSRKY